MDFIYFLTFWGVFLTICGIIALLSSNNHISKEDGAS